MERRTFIKTVILGIPALSLGPLTSLGWGSPARTQTLVSPEFAIFFIGKYGRAVMGHFQRLRQIDPILKPCEHVTMNVHSEQGLYEIADAGDLMPVLAEAARLRLGCFVYDPAVPGAAAMAGVVASMLKAPQNLIMSMTPRMPQGACSNQAFDFEFTTAAGAFDFTPSFLLTIHNTFLGCGQFGEYNCLKCHLESLRSVQRDRKGHVSVVFRERGCAEPATLTGMVVQGALLLQGNPGCGSLGALWGILEISYVDFQHQKGLDFFDSTSEQLQRLSMAYEGCLFHPGLTGTKLKLSLIEWS